MLCMYGICWISHRWRIWACHHVQSIALCITVYFKSLLEEFHVGGYLLTVSVFKEYTVSMSNFVCLTNAIHWVSWTQTSLFNVVVAPKLWPMMKGCLDNYPFLPFLAPFHQTRLTDSLLLPSPMFFFFVAGWPNKHVRMTKLRTVLGKLDMELLAQKKNEKIENHRLFRKHPFFLGGLCGDGVGCWVFRGPPKIGGTGKRYLKMDGWWKFHGKPYMKQNGSKWMIWGGYP